MANIDLSGLVVGGLGKSPSTISVLHVVRNELLGILKRAANRGQILDHCNVELMVEEAMLESNLVQSVDEILSNCALSTTSINGENLSTKQAAPSSSASNETIVSCSKNERKIKMLSKLSKQANETLLKVGRRKSGNSQKETRYIVKKIIFDGLEELTYKYVTASSSSGSSDSSSTSSGSDDDCGGAADTEKHAEKRDEMLKFIKTPKMEFGGSSSSHDSSKFFGQSKKAPQVADFIAPPADHLSELTLVGSQHGANELIGDCNLNANEKSLSPTVTVAVAAVTPKVTVKENVSVIHMSEICVSSTKLKDSTLQFNEIYETKVQSSHSGDKLNIEASRQSIVRMSEVCESAKRAMCTVCKAKKLELDFVNRKLRRVKSCIIVKSMECLETTRAKHTPNKAASKLIRELKLEDLFETTPLHKKKQQQPLATESQAKKLKTSGESLSSNKGVDMETKNNNKNKNSNNQLTAKLTNLEAPFKSVPLKITLLKNRVNQEKTEKANLKSIKCKLNKIKTQPETEAATNENEQLKREIEKFFEKCAKSEPDRLRIIKTRVPVKLSMRKLQQQKEMHRKTEKYEKAEKAEKAESLEKVEMEEKQLEKPFLETEPIPAMSKLWLTLHDSSQPEKTASMPVAGSEKQAPAPIVLMSEMWLTQTRKNYVNTQQTPSSELTMTLATAAAAAAPPTPIEASSSAENFDEQLAPKKSSTKSRYANIKSFLDEERNQRLIRLKTKKPPQHPLTPDLQTKMLTAEWLSIAKQLKREQLSRQQSNFSNMTVKEVKKSDTEKKLTKSGEEVKAITKHQQQQQQLPEMQPPTQATNSASQLKTSTMKATNWCTESAEKVEKRQQQQTQPKLSDNNNENKPITLKSTWSALVRKWENETTDLEPQPQQPATLSPPQTQQRLSCSVATSLTLCPAKSLQNSSALTSVLTLVPQHLETETKSNTIINATATIATTTTATAPTDNKAVETKLSRHIDGASDTNVVAVSRMPSMNPLCRRSSTLAQRKKSGVKQVVSFKKKPPKEPTTSQRKENFMKTVEAMNFMLDAKDTVKTIDDGLDEQDLLNFRWNLEYQKREEAKRKAGKYDAATTMLTSIAGPPLNEVQTQTELPAKVLATTTATAVATTTTMTMTTPPLTAKQSTTAGATTATTFTTEMFAAPAAFNCTPNSIQVTHEASSQMKHEDLLVSFIDEAEAEFVSTINDDASATATMTTPNSKLSAPMLFQLQQASQQRLLTPLEMELLSKDYFSTLLDEIRDLLQTTNLLSAKAFSQEPLTLWDVREAGRKVIQLRVVKTSLGAKRMTFFVNIDKALQKQIEIMKTIVAYGKLIYPHDIRTNTAEKQATLQKLLNEFQQQDSQSQLQKQPHQQPLQSRQATPASATMAPQHFEPPRKVYNKANEAFTAQQCSRLQRTANTQSLNQYKLEMERRGRSNTQAYKEQQQQQPEITPASPMAYTSPKLAPANFMQATFNKHNMPPMMPAQAPPTALPLPDYAQQQQQQQHYEAHPNAHANDNTAANLAYQPLDYLSDLDDMSSESALSKVRNVKAAKRSKKPKQAQKPLEFQLTGFKPNNKKHNSHNVHRRYHQQQQFQQEQQQQQLQQEQQQQQQQQFQNNLLASSLAKRPNAKRSKKATKPTADNVLNKNSAPVTIRIPAKNAPYKRTSYVLPVPADQPTGWELFKWNCGQVIDEPPNARAQFFDERNCFNAQERFKNNFVRNDFKVATAATTATPTATAGLVQGGVYRFPATTPPIWK